ncbi:MAG: recombinase family protein [Dehalococcoidia bacterium]|nr:recombinase family protein [Dehalococcoidia bacterium]
MSTRCVVYSRVSTDAQERDGTSLDSQERASIELATSRGWSVVRSIRDAASGFHLDREGIETLRGLLHRGEVDVVVAYAVDRLSRNQNHIGVLFDEIEQAGARLEFVTERFEDTAVGRFILAARAFIAEVEREKIVERTTRGKAERARGGRLPQGTGRGIYGYRYDVESGTRLIDLSQAMVVRRLFEEFADGRSCNRLANDLNDEGIPAFGGGRWYPLTIRRILLNETYVGRTIYRRTQVQKVRDVARGRWVRRVTERPQDEWIEVDGATPAIVSAELFERVRQRLEDPERKNRGRASFEYPLRGRLRCEACGSAMVGQTLLKGRYRYYRCRRSYAGPRADRCESPYVPTELLEDAVRTALVDLVANPETLLAETRQRFCADPATTRRDSLDREIADIEAKQRRLVRLFTAGDLPESMLAEESRALAERRARLESERANIAPVATQMSLEVLTTRMPRALELIRAWISEAGAERLELLLEALNAHMTASRQSVAIRGEVPLIESAAYEDLVTIERTSA